MIDELVGFTYYRKRFRLRSTQIHRYKNRCMSRRCPYKLRLWRHREENRKHIHPHIKLTKMYTKFMFLTDNNDDNDNNTINIV